MVNHSFDFSCESCGANSTIEEWEQNTMEVTGMPIELEVQEAIKVDEGKHTATIVRVVERKEQYHYIDLHFRLDDVGLVIKGGYPASITENTKLGKLLERMGTKLEISTKLDLEVELLQKRVTLMTLNETKDGRTFARVVAGSVKPLQTEQSNLQGEVGAS